MFSASEPSASVIDDSKVSESYKASVEQVVLKLTGKAWNLKFVGNVSSEVGSWYD